MPKAIRRAETRPTMLPIFVSLRALDEPWRYATACSDTLSGLYSTHKMAPAFPCSDTTTSRRPDSATSGSYALPTAVHPPTAPSTDRKHVPPGNLPLEYGSPDNAMSKRPSIEEQPTSSPAKIFQRMPKIHQQLRTHEI
jgi:hypothetical protein